MAKLPLSSSPAPAPLQDGHRAVIGDRAELGRFMISGSLGSAFFLALYELIHWAALVGSRANAAFSWALAYGIASLLTHELHRRITFHSVERRSRTLIRTYVIYGLSLIGSTILHDQLTHGLQINHQLSFVLTLLISGSANYLAFRHWGFRPETQA